MAVKLTDIIAPHFYELHWDIKEGKHTHYKIFGGRGSMKSSFVSIEIVKGIMEDRKANAVVFRKVGNTLRESVYEQLLWAIDALGVTEYWEPKLSPLSLVYSPTGQKIIFRGCDDSNKTKSIKTRIGYFKYIWYEERAEFDAEEDERKINQSLMRGGDKYVVFYTWNPPRSLNNWVNQDVLQEREDTLCNHSTYLTAPKEWLGEQFFLEAEELKNRNLPAYQHEYLGIPVGTGGKVFHNVTTRAITDAEIMTFDKIRQGLDFGFATDPLAYVRCHFNKKQRRLYIFDEIYKVNLSTTKVVEMIRQKNKENSIITADSEEPRSINSLNEAGLRVVAAKKGPGSVDFGMNYLQNEIDEIIIDPQRCPNVAREFTTYELEKDRYGNFKAGYPDKDNHSIDATRYALEEDFRNRKAKILDKKKMGLR